MLDKQNNLNSHLDLKSSGGCFLCPRNCGALRNDFDHTGVCGVTKDIYISTYQLHFYEEPCISGKNGSGTIFFYGCPLKCIYCQNSPISNCKNLEEKNLKKYNIEDLVKIYFELEKMNAHNINFVTGTQYIPEIAESIKLARSAGLKIPTVWNTSGYESIESLKLLNGYIDIFLTDFRYIDNELAKKFSAVNNYVEVVKEAIDYMFKICNENIYDQLDSDIAIMKKGVIIRILVLPSHVSDSKRIIDYLINKYGKNICISLMSQYTPMREDFEYEELNRRLTKREYEKIINYVYSLGLENVYIQDMDSASTKYIPNFS